MSDERIWYYADGDQRKGPVDETALMRLVSGGAIVPQTLVWTAGMENWADAGAAFSQHGVTVNWSSPQPPSMPAGPATGSQLRASMRQGQQGAMFGAGAAGAAQAAAGGSSSFDAGAHPVGMVEAVKTVLRKYATFSGRARRPEYWWFYLAYILTDIVLSTVDVILFSSEYGVLSPILNLGMLIPSLAVGARRLHDIGRSGWWQLLIFIPILGWIVLIWWWTRPGDPQDNRFGPA